MCCKSYTGIFDFLAGSQMLLFKAMLGRNPGDTGIQG